MMGRLEGNVVQVIDVARGQGAAIALAILN
jgi:hypothetical protein